MKPISEYIPELIKSYSTEGREADRGTYVHVIKYTSQQAVCRSLKALIDAPGEKWKVGHEEDEAYDRLELIEKIAEHYKESGEVYYLGINAGPSYCYSPFGYAVLEGKTDAADALLRGGVDIDRDAVGNIIVNATVGGALSAVDKAVYSKEMDALDYLLLRNAKPSYESKGLLKYSRDQDVINRVSQSSSMKQWEAFIEKRRAEPTSQELV